jgi:hypothetical protein
MTDCKGLKKNGTKYNSDINKIKAVIVLNQLIAMK